MRSQFLLFLALGSALLAGSALAVPGVGFPDGVASGEVTPMSAVLWTRVDTRTPIKVEVSTNPKFQGPKAFKQRVRPSSDDDLTIRVLTKGLVPGTTYYYRFRHGAAVSTRSTRTPRCASRSSGSDPRRRSTNTATSTA